MLFLRKIHIFWCWTFTNEDITLLSFFQQFRNCLNLLQQILCSALRDLVPCTQFKKLYKWYQIAQSTTYSLEKKLCSRFVWLEIIFFFSDLLCCYYGLFLMITIFALMLILIQHEFSRMWLWKKWYKMLNKMMNKTQMRPLQIFHF